MYLDKKRITIADEPPKQIVWKEQQQGVQRWYLEEKNRATSIQKVSSVDGE
jgi:hypothetical protein